MNHTTRGEQLTAIFSALIAVLLLGAGVAAHQTQRTTGERISQLESDLRLQLDVAYRRKPAEKRERLEQLDAALQAWRNADRAMQNDQRIVVWLQDAIIRSIPGSVGQLPKTPTFTKTRPIEALNPARGATPRPSPNHDRRPIERESAPRPNSDVVLSTADKALIQQQGELQPIPREETPAGPSSQRQRVDAFVATAPDRAAADVADQPPVERRFASNRSADRPAPDPAEIAKSYHVQGQPAQASPKTSSKASSRRTRVSVNLHELTYRVAGYHDGLDQVNAHLDGNIGALTYQQISAVVEQMEQLELQYRFVQLYYDTLSAEARRRVLRPRPLTQTVQQIRRELGKVEASDVDFLTFAGADRSPKYQALERRLTEMLRSAGD